MEYPIVDQSICVGCAACADLCIMDAIEIVHEVAKIDLDRCSACFACRNVCPIDAID